MFRSLGYDSSRIRGANTTGFDSDIRSQVVKIDTIDFGGSVEVKRAGLLIKKRQIDM